MKKLLAAGAVFTALVFVFTLSVAAQDARKVDEYGKLRAADEKARLDNFAIELKADPTASGYIICYGGRSSTLNEAKKAMAFAKTYLVTKRKIAKARVITIDGGYKDEANRELWIAPTGAAAPYASPTVDPSEAVLPKKKAPVKRKK